MLTPQERAAKLRQRHNLCTDCIAEIVDAISDAETDAAKAAVAAEQSMYMPVIKSAIASLECVRFANNTHVDAALEDLQTIRRARGQT